MNNNMKIFALGGLDENGRNLYVIEIRDEIILIEAGIKYPETDQLGVSMILPDFSYIIRNRHKVKGIFISHAHDDVMGAIAALLKEIKIPVYTTKFTARIIERLCKDEKCSNYDIRVIKRTDQVLVGHNIVKTFPLTSSTPDSFGLAIHTEYGYIVYCGEFLFDLDTKNPNFISNIADLADIGKEKVFALLTESNGADHDGYTSPKHQISSLIESTFTDAKDRILITCYQQNIYRILEILDLCVKYHKMVFFYDNELKEIINILGDLGYYSFPKKNIVKKELFTNDIDNVVVIVSGIGTSVFSSMMKISNHEDDTIYLKETDTVIIASPANQETEIDGSKMKNELYKENVKIISLDGSKVYSGHASKEDIKMMAYLFKPLYYIPIKAEYRHLISNANIALDMGYRADHIVVLDNGQIATFTDGVLTSCSDLIDVDEIMIGNSSDSDISSFVLKDREILSKDGAIIVGVVLNYNTKEIIGGPDVQSRGMIYLKDADYIVKEVGNILVSSIEDAVREDRYENMQVRMEARDRITRYLLKETGKRPMILPAIVEINYSDR